MIIRQIEVGGMLNFAYIIGDPKTKQGIVIDPSWEPERIYEVAKGEGIIVKYLVNTHCHEDHVNGNKRMKEMSGAIIAIHEAESRYLRHFFPPEADMGLKDGDILNIGEIPVSVIHTPGHSPGSICLMAGNNIFTGDTLFVGSCGRTDLPGGDVSEFKKTMLRLKTIEDTVTVHPGHNYGDTPLSTMGREKRLNPCLLSV